MKRIISDINGLKTTMEMSTDGKQFTINKTQDVAPVLEQKTALSNIAGKKAHDDCYNRVASIPAGIVAKWLIEEGLDIYNPDHAERLKRKLNDSEWQYLRTNEMTL